MNWNDTAYTEIVAKHPLLESKPESVALAAWALTQKPDMSAQDWRDLFAQTGVRVAGRALGSAREILGLGDGRKQGGGTTGAKQAPRRAKGGRRVVPSAGSEVFGDLISTLRNLQRERDDAVAVVEKIRALLHST